MNREADSSPSREPGGTLSSLTSNRKRAAEAKATASTRSRAARTPRPTLPANVAHGPGHGLTGAAVAAWPAVALVGSYELLMVIIRSAQMPPDAAAESEAAGTAPGDDPVQAQAAQTFADEVAAGCVPSVRAIRARLHVGQPRAQRVRAYLAGRPNP